MLRKGGGAGERGGERVCREGSGEVKERDELHATAAPAATVTCAAAAVRQRLVRSNISEKKKAERKRRERRVEKGEDRRGRGR